MASLMPPRWKDLESDERYGKLTPTQRLGVFNKWLTDATTYGSSNGWWSDPKTTDGFRSLVKTKLPQLTQGAFEESKVGGFEDVKDATARAGTAIAGAPFRLNQVAADALLGVSKAIDYVPGLVAQGLNTAFGTDLKVDSWLTSQLRTISQANQNNIDQLSEKGAAIGGGELGDLAEQFAAAGSDAVADVGAAMMTGGGSVPGTVARRAAPGLMRGVLTDLAENFIGPSGRQLRIASTLGSGRSYSGTWNEAVKQYTDLGMSRQDAEAKATPEALNAGAATYLITMLGGKTGVESVLKNSGAQGLKNRLREVITEAASEGIEEGTDQTLQDLNERFIRNPDKAVADSFKELKYAVGLGALLGGGFSAVGQTVEKLQENGAPLTAEAVARGWWETPEKTSAKIIEVKTQLDKDFGPDDDLVTPVPKDENIATQVDDLEAQDAATAEPPVNVEAKSAGVTLPPPRQLPAPQAPQPPPEPTVNVLPTGPGVALPPQRMAAQNIPDDAQTIPEVDTAADVFANVAQRQSSPALAPAPAPAPASASAPASDLVEEPQPPAQPKPVSQPEAADPRLAAPTPDAQAYEDSLVQQAKAAGIKIVGVKNAEIEKAITGKGWYPKANIKRVANEIKERVRGRLEAEAPKTSETPAVPTLPEGANDLIAEARKSSSVPSSATINQRYAESTVEERRAVRREAAKQVASDLGIEYSEELDFAKDFDGNDSLPIRVTEKGTEPVFVNNADVTARQIDAGFTPVIPESRRSDVAEGITFDAETGQVTSAVGSGVTTTQPGELARGVRAQRPGTRSQATLATPKVRENALPFFNKLNEQDQRDFEGIRVALQNRTPSSREIAAAFAPDDLIEAGLIKWARERVNDRTRAKDKRKNYSAGQIWNFVMKDAAEKLKTMPRVTSLDAPITETGTMTRGDTVAAQDRLQDKEESQVQGAREAAIEEADAVDEGVAADEETPGGVNTRDRSGTGMSYSKAYSIINSPRVLLGAPKRLAAKLRAEAQEILDAAGPMIETLENDDIDYWNFTIEDFQNVDVGNPGAILSSSKKESSPYILEQVSWMASVARALGLRNAQDFTPPQFAQLARFYADRFRGSFDQGATSLPENAVADSLPELRSMFEGPQGAASAYREAVDALRAQFPGATIRYSTKHNAAAWYDTRLRNTLFLNPLLLEQELNGLSAAEAYPFLNAVLFEEYIHAVEKQTIPREITIAIAQRLPDEVRQRVIESYIGSEDRYGSAEARQEAIDGLDDAYIGSEYIRMMVQRMRNGLTTEDLDPLSLPQNLLQQIMQVIKALIARLQSRLRVARDPLLAHTIRALQGGMRKLELQAEIAELNDQDLELLRNEPGSSRFIFAKPRGVKDETRPAAPDYKAEALKVKPGRSYWITPEGRIIDVVAEDQDGTNATHGKYIRSWIKARIGKFFPGEYEKEAARILQSRAQTLMAQDSALREELDREAVEESYLEESNLAEVLGNEPPDYDAFIQDAINKLGPSDMAYNEAATESGWARIAVPPKFSPDTPIQIQTRKNSLGSGASKTIKEIQGQRVTSVVDDGAVGNKAVNRSDIGWMLQQLRNSPGQSSWEGSIQAARPRGPVDSFFITAINDIYATDQKLSDVSRLAKRSGSPINPPEEGKFVSLQEGTQRYRHNLQVRRDQASALTEWARGNGLLLENQAFETRWQEHRQEALRQDPTLDPDEVANGVEHDVYFDEPSQRWFKRGKGMTVTAPTMFVSYDQYFDRLAAHRALFPDTAMRLEGFVEYEFEEGGQLQRELAPVVSQPHIKAERGATREETIKFMQERGFKMVRPQDKRNGHKNWVNKEGIVVEDLHDENIVVTPEGDIKVIDPVIYLPESFKIQAARPGVRIRGKRVGGAVLRKPGGFFSSGAFTTTERSIILKASQKIAKATANAEFLVNEFRRAVKKAYGKSPAPLDLINQALGSTDNRLTDQQVTDLKKIRDKDARELQRLQFMRDNRNQARIDRRTALSQLPAPVAKAVEDMGAKIDELSVAMMTEGYIADDLIPVFEQNLELYLNRSYAIFESKTWKDNMVRAGEIASEIRNIKNPVERQKAISELSKTTKEHVRVRVEFERFATERAIAEYATEIRRKQKQNGVNITRQDAIQLAKADTATVEGKASDLVLRYLTVADQDAYRFFVQGRRIPGRRNMDIIKVRGQIPKELREFWGEIKNAETNFTQTVSKMAAFMAHHDVATELLNHGITEGYIWKAGASKNPNRNPEFVELIPKGTASAESISPLYGAYGPVELRDALVQMTQPQNTAGWARAFSFLTAMAMAMKTIGYVPRSFIRNFFGNPLIVLGRGLFNISDPLSMAKAMGDGFRVARLNAGLGGNASYQALRERLLELGVIGDNVRGTLLKKLYEESTEGEKIAELLKRTEYDTALEKMGVKAAQMGYKGASTLADIYQGVDDIWKVYAWEMEKVRQKRAHPTWDARKVEEAAATNVRNLIPTYSLSPEITQRIRRVPLFAPFITWTSEILRTTGNNIALAKQEIQEGYRTNNKPMRNNGIMRLAGFISATAALPAFAMGMKSVMGYDDEDEEAIRTSLRDWQKNSQLIFISTKDQGKVRFLDLSYLDPNQVFVEPLIAASRAFKKGDNPFASWSTELLRPLFSEQLFVGAMADVMRNRTADGRPIVNDQDTNANKTLGYIQHVGEAIGPGTLVSSVPNIVRGSQGKVSSSGKVYSLSDEVYSQIFGSRISEIDAQTTLGQAAGRYLGSDAEATRLLNDTLLSRGSVDINKIGPAYENADRAKEQLFNELRDNYKAALRLGVPKAKAIAVLRTRNISQDLIRQIVNDRYTSYQPTAQTFNEAVTRPDGRARARALREYLIQKRQQNRDENKG